MSKKVVLFIAGFLLCLNILCWGEIFVLVGPEYLEVSFLDVGQGDSAFIQTPEGHQIVIDGGPNADLLQKLSERMPFWDKTIDVVILTHPEKDHMTGLLEILQRYKINYFLWTGVVKDDAGNKKLAKLLNDAQIPPKKFLLASLSGFSGTKVITINQGDKIRAGDLSINIIHPFEDINGQEPKNTNDSSVVSKLVFGNNSFLFTGDISFAVEKNIINSGEDILSNVLKIAHHGSKYSTSDLFLQNIGAQYAVIEVGKNSYGHPTPETLQRLEKFGIKVFRTDKDGDIKFVSDGNNIKIYNF
jgi:competence protein ComEC